MLNTLISMYLKCGDVDTSRSIFEGMGNRRDLVSWSAMVSSFANSSMELQAIWIFRDMLELGFCPNEYCLTAVIRACSNANYSWVGERIYGSALKTGYFGADVCVGCELVDMFAKSSGDLGSAYKVFVRKIRVSFPQINKCYYSYE